MQWISFELNISTSILFLSSEINLALFLMFTCTIEPNDLDPNTPL